MKVVLLENYFLLWVGFVQLLVYFIFGLEVVVLVLFVGIFGELYVFDE